MKSKVKPKSAWIGVMIALAASLGAVDRAGAADEPKLLNIYNGSDCIADDSIARFEKETGIRVR